MCVYLRQATLPTLKSITRAFCSALIAFTEDRSAAIAIASASFNTASATLNVDFSNAASASASSLIAQRHQPELHKNASDASARLNISVKRLSFLSSLLSLINSQFLFKLIPGWISFD